MSAGSGIAVVDDVVEVYKKLQAKHEMPYVFFKLSEDLTQVVVDSDRQSTKDSTWDDFVAHIPDDECRYAVYDFKFETNEGGKREKIVLFIWNPDCARVKQKMLYASTKDALKKKLTGVGHEVQCDCKGDLNQDELAMHLKTKIK